MPLTKCPLCHGDGAVTLDVKKAFRHGHDLLTAPTAPNHKPISVLADGVWTHFTREEYEDYRKETGR